jgi:DHA1 family bicyclomycin/chloramphenicol resistance-like MFS transporter
MRVNAVMVLKSMSGTAPQSPPFALSFAEFVSLIAFLIALTALSIDIMLPALPQIADAMQVRAENDRQLVITVYILGFASGQLLFGPISDRFGRRMPLLAGLALYIASTVFALAAGSFPALLAARAAQGFGAASPRTIAFAIVRDRFGGRDMARVMSFVMMVFIIVPILAPSVGQGLLQAANWRSIFYLLLCAAFAAAAWAWLRLPETRPAEDRMPLSASAIFAAAKLVCSTRQTAGYVIAMGFVFGIMMSYIISAEQIFMDVYHLGALFPLAFAAIACFMVAASVVNASVVRKVGMRAVSHRALLGAAAVCGIAALAGYPDHPPLLFFCAFMAAIFFCFGLIMPNFNALAMEPMAHIAGTASSFAGFYSTSAAALFGTLVGRFFDGGVRPLFIGVTILVLAALGVVLYVERFRLARQGPPPAPGDRTVPVSSGERRGTK